jgi:hypothetical protein
MLKKTIIALIIILLFNPFYGVFAQTTNSGVASPVVEKIPEFLNTIVKLFSVIWIIPAIIAGKLMTNDFVYGAMFNLDIYLWKIWNVMKNLANYTL